MADETLEGHQDRWIIYKRLSPDGWDLVVRSRIGNDVVDFLRLQGSVIQIALLPSRDEINERGMPKDFPRVRALEDAILAGLAPGALHCASSTGDGARVAYLVHDGTYPLQPVQDLVQSLLPPDIAANVDQLTELDMFRAIAIPTELDRRFAGDCDVIVQLRKSGDALDVPRAVDFFFYGPVAKLSRMVDHVARTGFDTAEWLEAGDGVRFTRLMPVAESDFAAWTPRLLELEAEFGVEYDGWETSVILPTAS